MKIAIIHSVSGISARDLKEHLELNGQQADIFRPYTDGNPNLTKYDYVFSFGCSAGPKHNKRLNNRDAVIQCIDKVKTFNVLKKAGIPTVNYVQDARDIPKDWEQVCCRTSLDGKKGEGLDYFFRDDVPKHGYKLFTEVYHGEKEYRVMVFNNWVGVYWKRKEGNDWMFRKQPNRGFEKLIADAKKAANALGIDYVGFDVLAKSKTDYVFLEANSGATLTPEASTQIVTFFINL